MGLYFNTVETTEMHQKVSILFNKGNIDFWKNEDRRKRFRNSAEGGNSLALIAGSNGIFPNAGASSAVGKRWFQWLDDLEDHSTGQSLRSIFHKFLGSGERITEIIFNVTPKASLPIHITSRPVVQDGDRYIVVTIETPTARAVREAIKSKMKTRKKKR